MMQKLKEEITAAANRELNRAIVIGIGNTVTAAVNAANLAAA